jgi:ABC-type amino acid transport substrate-binding protein
MQRRQLMALAGGMGPALNRPLRAQSLRPLRYLQMDAGDAFSQYVLRLLQTALLRADWPARLQPMPAQMLSQGRLLAELESGRLDLLWLMTSAEREQQLLPVRVPLDRGLLGWRLLLVRQDDLPHWATPPDLAQLGARVGGQGAHWPDLEILRANGLRCEPVVQADRLFAMLAQGRIDYLPRSVLEVGDELRRHAALRLTIAPGLMLHYPAASYLFLRRSESALATRLASVFDAMSRDGSLQALFQSQLGPLLAPLDLPRRRVLSLRNPLLPARVPLDDSRYWERLPQLPSA